ncbi:interleukin-5 receptor subunit alpha-like isoform X2 [Gopherus evgoodei]|uniref:interleukin-5 receptor subunit alpha-like isoform X2 n=1 Tax=Gopherus evgoodei TaxID=1825980 RepID=UPI0011CF4EE6|nr:interleukin-5 receptor subunit alpha-like isoform X2 [Gopherus evgoodei]
MLLLSLTWYEMISVSLANGEPAITASIMAPSDLHIVKHDFGVILSWNSNITEEIKTYYVKYVLIYKFDTAKEITERLQEKEKMIRLGLHSGFHAKVKTQLLSKESEDIIKESNWTEFTYKAPPVYIQNFSCVIYNISNLNCTWDIKTEAPEDAQYFLSYRHSREEFQCQLYFTNAKNKNIGCHMKEVYFNHANKIRFNITVKELSNSSENHSYYKKFTPQRLEKLNPPINVSISLENRSIKINWKPPPTIGSAKKKCFTYQVKITDLEPVDVSEEEYVHPIHDPAKKYVIQVRAKKTTCISNKFWSEWSEPVFINDEYKDYKMNTWKLLILILFPSMIFTGGLLIFLCRRYKCIDPILTPIPHPSDRIRIWLASDAALSQEYGLVLQTPDMLFISDLSTPVTELSFDTSEVNSEIMLVPLEKNKHKRIS